MHPLLAAKGGVMRVNAILRVVLIVPLMQQLVLHCCKCWPCCTPCLSFATAGTAAVIFCSSCYWSLPLKAACWALPLSPKFTTSKHLLRCLGVLGGVPILCLSRCFGSKRAVLTYCFPLTIRALGASCAAIHSCHPDMRASCWTLGARPHDFQAAAWLDLDAAKQSIVVRMPLLLQLGAELTDVWQARLDKLDLLLLWMCCCGTAIVSRSCSSTGTFQGKNSSEFKLAKVCNKPHLSVAD